MQGATDVHSAGRAGAAKRRGLASGPLSLVQIFSSMRFGDTHGVVPMAEALQTALEARGIQKNHIINMKAGGDIDAEVFSKIEASEIFLVFGSARYGEDTGNQASTFYESKYAHQHKKKIVSAPSRHLSLALDCLGCVLQIVSSVRHLALVLN